MGGVEVVICSVIAASVSESVSAEKNDLVYFDFSLLEVIIQLFCGFLRKFLCSLYDIDIDIAFLILKATDLIAYRTC